MDITELRKLCEELEAQGFGTRKVFKSSDDEWNSYQLINSIDICQAIIFSNREIEIICEEDLEEYDDEYLEESTFIACIY